MRQRASIRDDRWWGWAGGGYLRGRPAHDHWMNSPSSGQHTAHYSPVIIATFVDQFIALARWRPCAFFLDGSGAARSDRDIPVVASSIRGIGLRASSGDNMARRSLTYKWPQEDRLTRAKWMCAVAIFYGCIGLLVVGALALTKSSSIAPNGATDRQAWRAGITGERVFAMPKCPGKLRESCTTPPMGE